MYCETCLLNGKHVPVKGVIHKRKLGLNNMRLERKNTGSNFWQIDKWFKEF